MLITSVPTRLAWKVSRYASALRERTDHDLVKVCDSGREINAWRLPASVQVPAMLCLCGKTVTELETPLGDTNSCIIVAFKVLFDPTAITALVWKVELCNDDPRLPKNVTLEFAYPMFVINSAKIKNPTII